MYYLLIWQDSIGGGTALAFKTKNIAEFKEKFNETTKKYKPYKNLFKITRYNNCHILSYCSEAKAFPLWLESKPTGKVDICEITSLDNIFKLL